METPFEKPSVSQNGRERTGEFKSNPMWADHERPEDHGDVVNSGARETREQEIARLLRRGLNTDVDVEGYEKGDGR